MRLHRSPLPAASKRRAGRCRRSPIRSRDRVQGRAAGAERQGERVATVVGDHAGEEPRVDAPQVARGREAAVGPVVEIVPERGDDTRTAGAAVRRRRAAADGIPAAIEPWTKIVPCVASRPPPAAERVPPSLLAMVELTIAVVLAVPSEEQAPSVPSHQL